MRIVPCIIAASITALLATSIPCMSQRLLTFNPGIKIGHTLGDRGGFTLGLELSIFSSKEENDESSLWGYGLVASYDYCFAAERHRLHFGAELTTEPPLCVGFDLGPTFLLSPRESGVGITVTSYALVLAIPYYSITYLSSQPQLLQETGVAAKLPIPLEGQTPRIFSN